MMDETYTMPNRQDDLLINLNEHRKTGHLCDITLVIDNQELHAHKVILSASSQYFRLMFGEHFQESRSNVIEMHEVDYLAIRNIFDFIYTSKIQLNEDNILNIMEAADILQIHNLRRYINHFLKRSLSLKNCLIAYATAKFRDYEEASEVAFRYIVEHFDEVLKESDFDELPADVWQRILSSDVINVQDDNSLLIALVKWYEHSAESRLVHLNFLSSFINIAAISPIKLRRHIESSSLEGTEFYLRIINAIEFQDNDSSKSKKDIIIIDDEDYIKRMQDLNLPINFKQDRYLQYNNVILVNGGSNTSSPECFTGPSNPWTFRLPPWGPFRPRDDSQFIIPGTPALSEAATACNNSQMFVLGGYVETSSSLLKSCFCYNIKTNCWTSMTALPIETTSAAASFCNGKLYFAGGVNDCNNISVNTVMCYLEEPGKIGQWVQVAPMLNARTTHELCSVNGELYAIGGAFTRTTPLDSNVNDIRQSVLETLRTVERYSPLLNEWKSMSSMHSKRMGFCSAVFDEFIYVFGGSYYKRGSDKSMMCKAERYNTLTDMWEPLEPMPFLGREGFSATVFKNRIYILGGADAGMKYNSVHIFNPFNCRWQYAAPMHFERVNASVVTLSLPEDPVRRSGTVCVGVMPNFQINSMVMRALQSVHGALLERISKQAEQQNRNIPQ